MRASDWAKRLVVLVVVAGIVVGGTVGAALVDQPGSEGGGDGGDPVRTPEYDPESLAVTPSPAEGTIEPDASVGEGHGTILVDTRHSNGLNRNDLQPLVDAIHRVGYTVEFGGNNLGDDELDDVDAFVVIDPGSRYNQKEVDAVRKFTNRGGRLLVLGEPNRKRISGGLFGVSISNDEAEVTTLLSEYNFSVDSRYLYNLEENDGNYRYLAVSRAQGGNLRGVRDVTLFTAAAVDSQNGQPLLVAPENSVRSPGGEEGAYPVAIVDGDVLVVGDSTFVEAGRHNVADNEAFIANLVEYLIGSDRVKSRTQQEDGDRRSRPDDTDDTTDNATANETTNETANETAEGAIVAPVDDGAGAELAGVSAAVGSPVDGLAARPAR